METFYVFVNFVRGIARHNLRVTRQFTSSGWSACSDATFRTKYIDGTATYAPFVATTPDCQFISPFLLSAMSTYRVEYDAERTRLLKFPKLPSRLSSIYAFGDFATCELVATKYKWDLGQVRRFRLERDPLTRVHKCNMEIVSLSRGEAEFPPSQEFLDAMWEAYWSGKPTFKFGVQHGDAVEQQVVNRGEIWEYLIEGRLVLQEGEANIPT